MTPRIALALTVTAAAAVATMLSPTGSAALASAQATHYRLNPAHNIAPPNKIYKASCRTAPRGKACTKIFVAALDHARSVMKQPKYAVPSRFASLQPQEQLLVLSNLDRALYKRTVITGLSPALTKSAQQGARKSEDPDFVETVNGARLHNGGSNWAGGSAPMGSPLFAYYEWMYDDGPGSGNQDCQHKGDPGCWGHRDDTLFPTASGDQAELGVGRAKPHGYFSWTELYESFAGSATIPCVPTVTGLSAHSGPLAGGTLKVRGFGFVQVKKVTVDGRRAPITKRSFDVLTITVPAGRAGSGYVVVTTASGSSNKTSAAAYRYAG